MKMQMDLNENLPFLKDMWKVKFKDLECYIYFLKYRHVFNLSDWRDWHCVDAWSRKLFFYNSYCHHTSYIVIKK